MITNSTTPPFSDKYLLYQIQLSTQLSIGYYGYALSVNSRRDIGIHYLRLTLELMKFAEDGANLMIKNGWLEQPPTASDRDSLAKLRVNETRGRLLKGTIGSLHAK
jgi:hypothetical protein